MRKLGITLILAGAIASVSAAYAQDDTDTGYDLTDPPEALDPGAGGIAIDPEAYAEEGEAEYDPNLIDPSIYETGVVEGGEEILPGDEEVSVEVIEDGEVQIYTMDGGEEVPLESQSGEVTGEEVPTEGTDSELVDPIPEEYVDGEYLPTMEDGEVVTTVEDGEVSYPRGGEGEGEEPLPYVRTNDGTTDEDLIFYTMGGPVAEAADGEAAIGDAPAVSGRAGVDEIVPAAGAEAAFPQPMDVLDGDTVTGKTALKPARSN